MDELIQSVLDKWLEIEYYHVANKAGFINEKRVIKGSYKLIIDTIRCLDYLTTVKNDYSSNYVITVIALMWEHVDRNEYDIRNFVLKILTRIGYPTSAIIIDDEFDFSEGKFFRPNSVIDMLTLTLQHQKNEITIMEHVFLLTDFQIEIWNGLNEEKLIGISAPTSAGKSFVILLNTISKIISENIDVVYIIPTLSLLNQVTEDYNKMLKKLGVKNYKIVNSFNPNVSNDYNTIYVLTQEKALAAFSNEKTAFTKKMILVADEIQNIERIQIDSDLRSKILYDTLIEFRNKKNVEQIIISGPRIEEIDTLGHRLFGKKAHDITTTISPVLNLTYSIKKVDERFYFKQYCAIKDNSYSRLISNPSQIAGYGNKQYSSEYMDYLFAFIQKIGLQDQNIIFAPTSKKAKEIACFLSDKSSDKSKDLNDLIEYYRDSINENYAMCITLEKGIAYHHGKLPMHVRRTIEKAISDKVIQNVVCTTTLMQGVNMPAQNVIIRNPHLYTRKKVGSAELSSYEMANLRGRAGRLLKDFIGRTYVLDESGFEGLDEYNQFDLFEDTSVELPVGYGDKYEEYKNEVNEVLSKNESVNAGMNKYGYLVSYIRQTVLRYGNNAITRMNEVGISLTKEQVAAIINKMSSISVPKEICLKNRYWDPIVLDNIYTEFESKKLPITPVERGAKTRLNEMLKFLRDNHSTTHMYNRYVPELYREGIGRSILCNACMDWSCEKPLSEILSGERYSGEDATENIDNMIDTLQKVVSFNIPLLLKPIFDIFGNESIFLLCMQAGAYKAFTRRMIEMGVPRETSIYLATKLLNKYTPNVKAEDEIESIIKNVIKKNYSSLPYWIQVQLEFMI